MRLLMVNDEILTVENMKEEINWKLYGIDDVLTAYNVADGQKAIDTFPIDILLCDIEMPGQNGLELIRWIKEKKLNIECILLTCHADFEYAREAVTLGCQDYILIPAEYEKIGETVKKVVNRCLEKNENRKLQEYGRSWLHTQEESTIPSGSLSKTPKQIVNECIDYIMNNLDDEALSVNEIAAHFYLNAIYLNRIFKKEKGISIGQFIIREKMALASRLLKNPACQATSVANQVGYPNYSYFSSIFKKYYGCTPAQYRDTKINENL